MVTKNMAENKKEIEKEIIETAMNNIKSNWGIEPVPWIVREQLENAVKSKEKEMLDDEIKFLENNYANFTWEGHQRAIKPLQKRLSNLKERRKEIK